MNIDSIQNGVVLDHIQAGKSMEIYKHLNLDKLDCSVAIIKNVRSARHGKKDIIKIDSPLELDLDVLGYIDPNITVNIIKNGVRVEKKHLALPTRLVNVIHCHNPKAPDSDSDRMNGFIIDSSCAFPHSAAIDSTAQGLDKLWK